MIIYFAGGSLIMADSNNAGRLPLMFVDYEGPADSGRIMMRIGRDFAIVEYSRHPMVVTKVAPWRKKLTLAPGDVRHLFLLLLSEDVREYKCSSLTLSPGQDITIKSISVAIGKSPPFFTCSFVEKTPPPLVDVMKELELIYRKVKEKGEDSSPQRH